MIGNARPKSSFREDFFVRLGFKTIRNSPRPFPIPHAVRRKVALKCVRPGPPGEAFQTLGFNQRIRQSLASIGSNRSSASSFSQSKRAPLVTLSRVTNLMILSTEWEAPVQPKPHCSRRFTGLDSDLFTRAGFRLIRLQGNAADDSLRNIEADSPIEEPKSIGQAHDPGGSAICMTNLVLFRQHSAAGASRVCIWV